MIGMEMADIYANDIKTRALKDGLLLNVTSGNVIRLLPPLTISYDEIDAFLAIFEKLLP
jgi:acetylornithine/succinyldiaminopimelate/putrescine aminotransferase